ncbi:MAG: 50S ribosomal protein L29 [Candidatus Magasanikbacteria bacterium GW2011_GWC2_40_17]|uniref:Large ribosomal subunit protein uL29 n=1 Tax=Candidatus Magasanikbacteria bacterium GW2011_GWA2_42_32 TaxID=1619039 RepID=A0A0G1CDM1_9BACT|nr:MAG: 50S ribosomal protein L29 [Candidatus Magasanikbacteria bacterium GW2011_GWC2_40_17]KKS56796.1 MAG: 50S ribosomal protein L29 [Candidatus Magasanikbacteria bacterium GW2011_GWA2_42_32]OGH86018.1 MAG: 50S ribosomal protein L29 [Candidatus Magasanikbacteria bacterium RIFOXYB2_FULL_38_10]
MKEKEELKNFSPTELDDLLKKEQEKLRELRFRVSSRELKTVKDIEKTKKKIARIKTILNSLK